MLTFSAFIADFANVRIANTCTICSSNIICSGSDLVAPSKTFQINHPCRNIETPNEYNAKVLKHVVSEAPEYNVFYRGTAHLCDGIAIVELPEYFEALVHEDDRTVNLTPVFGWSPLVVKSRVVDNQFEVCTTVDGDMAQEFDWRVDARRNDEFVRISAFDRGQTDADANFIPVQWHDNGEEGLTEQDVSMMSKADLKKMVKRNLKEYKDTDTKENLIKTILTKKE